MGIKKMKGAITAPFIQMRLTITYNYKPSMYSNPFCVSILGLHERVRIRT